MADDALDYCAQASVDTDNLAAEAAYWLAGGVCALMTPDNWWATSAVLSVGLACGAGGGWEAGLSRRASAGGQGGGVPAKGGGATQASGLDARMAMEGSEPVQPWQELVGPSGRRMALSYA